MKRSLTTGLIVLMLFLLILNSGCQRSQPPITLTILHWNDFHSHNLPYRTVLHGDSVTVGGAAYLAALVDSLRLFSPNPVVLHAGDEFMGTPISTITKGKSQIEILNLFQLDAFEIGNHEFDYGWDTLKTRLAEAEFPVLCANVYDEATGKPIALTSIILKRSGVRIGIIGVDTRHLDSVVMGESLTGLRVEDPITVVNELLKELKDKTDIQIALTHQGVSEDERLAKGCPELDVIVGGHQHTRLYEPDVVNGIPILQAGAYGMFLGFFQATYDPASGKLTNFSEKLLPVYSDSIRPRKNIADLVAGQEVEVKADLDRVIGELTEPWIRSYRSESNVGDWTADAIVKLTGRDIAFMNSGGLRKNVAAGPVKVRDIWEVHPFGNTMQAFEISAAELQHIVQDFGTEASDFLQVGGMRFKVKKGSGKILELTIGGQPFDPYKTYTVAANAFVVGHDEKYFGFSLGDRPIEDLGWIDRDIALKAFEDEGTVTSKIDGRITIVE